MRKLFRGSQGGDYAEDVHRRLPPAHPGLAQDHTQGASHGFERAEEPELIQGEQHLPHRHDHGRTFR